MSNVGDETSVQVAIRWAPIFAAYTCTVKMGCYIMGMLYTILRITSPYAVLCGTELCTHTHVCTNLWLVQANSIPLFDYVPHHNVCYNHHAVMCLKASFGFFSHVIEYRCVAWSHIICMLGMFEFFRWKCASFSMLHIHVCMCTCMHTHIHMNTHTYTHENTHAHTECAPRMHANSSICAVCAHPALQTSHR